MSKNTSLFAQVLQFFSKTEFMQLVHQHKAEYKSKGFSCWQQFVSMLFCQLGRANSLSEIVYGLRACEGKLQHLGIEAPKKSTLAYVNEHRPWELYQSVFFSLLTKTRLLAATQKRKFRFKNKLYSMDSTTIDLCLSMYEWARFRRAKGAVKLHLRLDHDGYLPDYGIITDGKQHDVKIAKQFNFSPDSITVFDRGYNDYKLFAKICAHGAYFVTRLKSNATYTVVEERSVPQNAKDVISDTLIRVNGFYSEKNCPYVLRVIKFYDEKNDREFEFLTNNLRLSAATIAAIYKERWAIELFFKMLKQYLKIKTFVGTSINAVKTQIWTALIAMLVLRYLQLKSTFGWSLSTLSALLRMNIFTHRDLWAWINNPFHIDPEIENNAEQMELNFS
jgi:hypothetical protein